MHREPRIRDIIQTRAGIRGAVVDLDRESIAIAPIDGGEGVIVDRPDYRTIHLLGAAWPGRARAAASQDDLVAPIVVAACAIECVDRDPVAVSRAAPTAPRPKN